jgi:hypothetical protein
VLLTSPPFCCNTVRGASFGEYILELGEAQNKLADPAEPKLSVLGLSVLGRRNDDPKRGEE